MKPTATRIERMLEKIEARLVPPERRGLTVIVHELCEGQSREEAFAELKAHYPQNVVGKTVDDLNWSDDEAAAKEKVLAEHIPAHPEDAGRTVEDFDWWVFEIVSPKFIIGADGRVRWPDETIENIDKDTGGPSETLRIGLDQADSTPAPDSNGDSNGYPDHHRSGVVLSFAAGLRERSRRLGRPWQPRQPK
jgi:hypothetical protein